MEFVNLKDQGTRLKTQEKNAYNKILKLTPKSSRYLFRVGGRGKKLEEEGTGMGTEEGASAAEGRSETRPERVRDSARPEGAGDTRVRPAPCAPGPAMYQKD